MNKIAMYIGSFDMFTNGHIDVLEQVVDLFDKVYVVIGVNPEKKRRYTVDSSMQFIKDSLKDKPYFDKLHIDFTSLLAPEYADLKDCGYIIRGIRNFSDYVYEEKVAKVYKTLKKDIKIMWVTANKADISSSIVKLFFDKGLSIEDYVSGDYHILKEERK